MRLPTGTFGALAVFALAGCNLSFGPNLTGPGSGTGISAVYVRPSGWVLVVGDTVQLTASATTQQCDIDFCREWEVDASFTWTSSNPSIVTVSGGLVRAVGPGTTFVIAEAGGMQAAALVRVGSARIPLDRMGAGGRCALTSGGAAYCWGLDINSPDTALTLYQPRPLAGGLTFSAIAAGSAAACGITTDLRGFCWGAGYLGDGRSHFSRDPVLIAGGLTFRSLSAGKRNAANSDNEHICGVAADGAAWCWGANDAGQLGSDATLPSCNNGEIGHDYPCSAVPVAVAGGLSFAAISAGGMHTCALTTNGTAYCWGDNTWGQLGDSSTIAHPKPAPVRGAPGFTAVTAGADHTCGLTSAGQVWCWGRNEGGELGLGSQDTMPHPAPAPVASDQRFAALDAAHTTCGLTPAGQAYCWGAGVTSPTPVSGGLTFRSLGVVSLPTVFYIGYGFFSPTSGEACGIATDSRGYCWEGVGNPFPLVGPVQP